MQANWLWWPQQLTAEHLFSGESKRGTSCWRNLGDFTLIKWLQIWGQEWQTNQRCANSCLWGCDITTEPPAPPDWNHEGTSYKPKCWDSWQHKGPKLLRCWCQKRDLGTVLDKRRLKGHDKCMCHSPGFLCLKRHHWNKQKNCDMIYSLVATVLSMLIS